LKKSVVVKSSMHVQPNGINHAISCPVAPLISLNEKHMRKSAQLRPISTSIVGHDPTPNL